MEGVKEFGTAKFALKAPSGGFIPSTARALRTNLGQHQFGFRLSVSDPSLEAYIEKLLNVLA